MMKATPEHKAPAPPELDLEQLILVGGSEHGGTTLLAQLLDRHPEIACAPDVKFLNSASLYRDFSRFREMLPLAVRSGAPIDGYQNFQRLFRVLDHCQMSVQELVGWAQESADGREFTRRFAQHYLRLREKRRFAEKTPSNVYGFRPFLELFPSGVVIHIVRDGRDVYCSLRRAGHHRFRAASQWLYDTAVGRAVQDSRRYLEVRYEELVRAPEEVLQSVCRHIGVEYSSAMLDPSRTVWSGKRDKWRHDPTGPVTAKSVGSYLQEMSERDRRVFWNTGLTKRGATLAGATYPWGVRELMEELGYGRAETPVPRPSLLDRLGSAWDSAKWKTHILRSRSRLAWGYRPWRSPLTTL